MPASPARDAIEISEQKLLLRRARLCVIRPAIPLWLRAATIADPCGLTRIR